MPTLIFDDPFTVTLNTNLASHTPNTVGTSWTKVLDTTSPARFIEISATPDTITIDANQSAVQISYKIAPAPTAANVDVIFEMNDNPASATKNMGALFRYQDASNFYGIDIVNVVHLYKMVAGSPTLITSGSTTLGATHNIRVNITGSAIKVYSSTTAVLESDTWGTTEIDTTDAAISAAGDVHVFMGNVFTSRNVSDEIGATRFLVYETAAAGNNPKGVFGLPLHGPFGGPI